MFSISTTLLMASLHAIIRSVSNMPAEPEVAEVEPEEAEEAEEAEDELPVAEACCCCCFFSICALSCSSSFANDAWT